MSLEAWRRIRAILPQIDPQVAKSARHLRTCLAALAALACLLSLSASAEVVCANVREGDQIVKYFCPDQTRCVGSGSTWKCVPTVQPIDCKVCLYNQQRDSRSCMSSGDLIQQNKCINRVNAEYLRCQGICRNYP